MEMDWVPSEMSGLTYSEEFSILDSRNSGIIFRRMHHHMSSIFSQFTIFGTLDLDVPSEKTDLDSDMLSIGR